MAPLPYVHGTTESCKLILLPRRLTESGSFGLHTQIDPTTDCVRVTAFAYGVYVRKAKVEEVHEDLFVYSQPTRHD